MAGYGSNRIWILPDEIANWCDVDCNGWVNYSQPATIVFL